MSKTQGVTIKVINISGLDFKQKMSLENGLQSLPVTVTRMQRAHHTEVILLFLIVSLFA